MRLVGHSLTRRMMLTGYRCRRPPYRPGFVEHCVALERLFEVTLELAQEIASKSATASCLARHTLNTIQNMTLRDSYRYEQDMTAIIAATEDAKEARRAFLEKRAPVFKGS
jgi:enoyl-CoA hydratase